MSTCKWYYIPNILPILGGCSKPASSGVSRLFPVFITGNLAGGGSQTTPTSFKSLKIPNMALQNLHHKQKENILNIASSLYSPAREQR